jgi:hypothetical protein
MQAAGFLPALDCFTAAMPPPSLPPLRRLLLALVLLLAAMARDVVAQAPSRKLPSCWKAISKLKTKTTLARRLLRRSPPVLAKLKSTTAFTSTLFIPTNKAVTAGLVNLANISPGLAALVFNGTKLVTKAINRATPDVAASVFR